MLLPSRPGVIAALTCALASAPFQAATCQGQFHDLHVGVSGSEWYWANYIWADGDTARTNLKVGRKTIASANAWKKVIVNSSSASFRMGGHLMGDPAPKPKPGFYDSFPLSRSIVYAATDISFLYPYDGEPFSIVYNHSYTRDRLPRDAASELLIEISVDDESTDWGKWPIRSNGAGVISGVLPAGFVDLEISTTTWSGSVKRKMGRFEGAVTAGAFAYFGQLSPAAIVWQKSLTGFSNSAVLLRAEADELRDAIADEEALLALAKKDFPLPFDKAFAVSGKNNSFTIEPAEGKAARFQRFKTAVARAVGSYKDFKTTHLAFVDHARDAVKAGHLPGVTLLYLDWRMPQPPAGISQNLKAMTSLANQDEYTAAGLKLAKKRYTAARKAITSQLPSLRKRTAQLQGRHDFIIGQIGLAAEEHTRQIHADTSLTPREKEILLAGLAIADWSWER